MEHGAASLRVQPPGCGSGSRPVGRPAGGTELRLPGRGSSVTGPVEVSRTIRGIPTEVPLGRRDGLPLRCVVNGDNLLTIPKTWLEDRIGPLASEKLAALDEALKFSLGLR